MENEWAQTKLEYTRKWIKTYVNDEAKNIGDFTKSETNEQTDKRTKHLYQKSCGNNDQWGWNSKERQIEKERERLDKELSITEWKKFINNLALVLSYSPLRPRPQYYFLEKADLSLLVADWPVVWAVAGSRLPLPLSEGRVEPLNWRAWERVVIRSEVVKCWAEGREWEEEKREERGWERGRWEEGRGKRERGGEKRFQ